MVQKNCFRAPVKMADGATARPLNRSTKVKEERL
jgi:hypothetical protein